MLTLFLTLHSSQVAEICSASFAQVGNPSFAQVAVVSKGL